MRENILWAIHFGHAGRDALLGEASDIWWPRIHREIVETSKAKNCVECCQSGKNLICNRSQNEFGKLPEAKQPNEEISIDFAYPFPNSNKKNASITVSEQLFRLVGHAILDKPYDWQRTKIFDRLNCEKRNIKEN